MRRVEKPQTSCPRAFKCKGSRCWRSFTNDSTAASLECSNKTPCAVMMALMCSKFTTMACSRPRIVEGYESCGSRILRSRAGKHARRMMACFPASTICSLQQTSPTNNTNIRKKFKWHVSPPLPSHHCNRHHPPTPKFSNAMFPSLICFNFANSHKNTLLIATDVTHQHNLSSAEFSDGMFPCLI